MKRIAAGSEMKNIDKRTIENVGVPGIVLMERAAFSVASLIMKNENKDKTVFVVAGTGNNGADGLAVGRILFLNGYDICVYILGNVDKATDDFKTQLNIIKNLGIKESEKFEKKDITVDAIFGVGLSRDIEGDYKRVIEEMNTSKTKVYSVDISSGVSSDTGKVLGTAVKADYTVTFGCHKLGTVLYPGAEFCGEVSVADIGFPNNIIEDECFIKYATKEDLNLIAKRKNYSNKGTYGKVLIIAGSKEISGAAVLSAFAAFKTGAGMVRIFTHKDNREIIARVLPEAMINTYDLEKMDMKSLEACLRWCDVVAIGPGIGVGAIQSKMVEKVLESGLPAVIDADAINTISGDERIKKKLRKNVILTPHLKEMSRLLCISVEEISSDLIKYAKKVNYQYGANIVLKDARTVIVTNKGVYMNLSGNNGMATAGSGDVLTGIIAGLLGIKTDFDNSAFLGPLVHGLAGDMAAEEISKAGMMATDIIKMIPSIIK